MRRDGGSALQFVVLLLRTVRRELARRPVQEAREEDRDGAICPYEGRGPPPRLALVLAAGVEAVPDRDGALLGQAAGQSMGQSMGQS